MRQRRPLRHGNWRRTSCSSCSSNSSTLPSPSDGPRKHLDSSKEAPALLSALRRPSSFLPTKGEEGHEGWLWHQGNRGRGACQIKTEIAREHGEGGGEARRQACRTSSHSPSRPYPHLCAGRSTHTAGERRVTCCRPELVASTVRVRKSRLATEEARGKPQAQVESGGRMSFKVEAPRCSRCDDRVYFNEQYKVLVSCFRVGVESVDGPQPSSPSPSIESPFPSLPLTSLTL